MHKEMHTRTWEALYIVLVAYQRSTALETHKVQPETGLGADNWKAIRERLKKKWRSRSDGEYRKRETIGYRVAYQA